MPTNITQFTTLVQASGIESFIAQVQISGAKNSNDVVSFQGPSNFNQVLVLPGPEASNKLLAFGERSSTTTLVTPAGTSEQSQRLLVFLPDFSRSKALFSVIGTVDTAERFFDRSPFFFGSHEADPNTLRDLSEAQKFFIFSQTAVRSFSAFQNTTSSSAFISTKGELIDARVLAPVDVVLNGGFEAGLNNWQIVSLEVGDTVTLVNNSGGVFEGQRRLVTSANKNPPRTQSVALRQSIKLFRQFDSSILGELSFLASLNSTSSLIQNILALRFLKASQPQFILHYQLNGIPANLPAELIDFDIQIDLNLASGQVVSTVRALPEDTQRASFIFDEIEVWLVTDTASSTDAVTAWDAISLTLNVPNFGLLQTSSLAHLFTGHPVASELPFTISDSGDITIIDLSPPFFDEQVPASGSSFNPVDTSIVFHVKDFSTNVDTTSIEIFVQVNDDLNQVVTVGAPVTSTAFPTVLRTDLSNRNIRYEVFPALDFPQQALITVSGTFADFSSPANGTTQVYQFTMLGSGTLAGSIVGLEDGDPPSITLVEPTNLQTQVSPTTHLLWSTADNAAGVDPNSVVLTLNDKVALANDLGVTGLFKRLPNSNRGFDYEFTPATPFIFGQTVTGTISVADFAATPNVSQLVYEFTITPDDTLAITNFFLAPGENLLLTSQTVASVEVVDLVHGVDPANSFVQVNGQVPPGLSITTSGSGPDRLVFSFPLEPLVTFRGDLTIFVHAENKFPGAFPVVQEEVFQLRAGYDVRWFNRTERAEGGFEDVFPFITNIPVLTEVKNFARTVNTASQFFSFLTERVSTKDLGATIFSNINTADLTAGIIGSGPIFEFGKTLTLEIEVADLESNQFALVHTFTIKESI